MDTVKNKCKRVWESCRRRQEDGSSGSYNKLSKGRESLTNKNERSRQTSSSDDEKQRQKKMKKRQVAPQGCLWVQVGPERQRFAIKIELANHPLFKMLLDDAENEYGFRNDGPLWLPCDVDLFREALVEMKSTRIIDDEDNSVGCTFPKGNSPSVFHSPLSHRFNHSCAADYQLLSPYSSAYA